MKRLFCWLAVFATLLLTGCAASQKVTLGMASPPKALSSAALVPQDGNSKEMDEGIRKRLETSGIAFKSPVAAGTRTSADSDMLVAYTDVWRWDIAMYLKSLDINLFDAKTGNLIVTGRWENSHFHGFQNSTEVIKDLLDEMLEKIKVASSTP